MSCARAAARRLFAASAFLLAGCRTIDGTYAIVPPLYEVYDTPSSVGATTGSEYFFRPLGSYERLGPSSHHVRFATPFLDFRWGPGGQRYWVLPLVLYRSFPQPLGGEDVDWMVLPFFFGGNDPDEGSYFAVFPFGGTLKGLLAQDEIRFILFPFYWHQRSSERHSLFLVWPFYNQVWGGDWTGGRLFPFYGHYQARTEDGRLKYDRSFTLWPFYLRSHDQQHILPTEFFATLPFYGERINSRAETRAYLWPFFITHHDRRYDRTSYLGYVLPFRIQDGQTDFWPIYGVKRTRRILEVAGGARRTYRHFCLWPIERYEWATDPLEETLRFWLLPLVWHFYYIDKDTLETKKELKVWPFLRYRRQGEIVSLDVASPLWIGREDYERLYQRWFALFRYRWKPEVSGWEVLYGALMYRSTPPIQENVVSVLGGLLECGTRQGGFALKIFYIPLW